MICSLPGARRVPHAGAGRAASLPCVARRRAARRVADIAQARATGAMRHWLAPNQRRQRDLEHRLRRVVEAAHRLLSKMQRRGCPGTYDVRAARAPTDHAHQIVTSGAAPRDCNRARPAPPRSAAGARPPGEPSAGFFPGSGAARVTRRRAEPWSPGDLRTLTRARCMVLSRAHTRTTSRQPLPSVLHAASSSSPSFWVFFVAARRGADALRLSNNSSACPRPPAAAAPDGRHQNHPSRQQPSPSALHW